MSILLVRIAEQLDIRVYIYYVIRFLGHTTTCGYYAETFAQHIDTCLHVDTMLCVFVDIIPFNLLGKHI